MSQHAELRGRLDHRAAGGVGRKSAVALNRHVEPIAAERDDAEDRRPRAPGRAGARVDPELARERVLATLLRVPAPAQHDHAAVCPEGRQLVSREIGRASDENPRLDARDRRFEQRVG